MPEKIRITPNQALLLLIGHYSSQEQIRKQLVHFYLSGVTTEADKIAIEQWFTDPILSSYELCFDKKFIDEDPSQHYFETHLVYHTLENELDTLPTSQLQSLLRHILIELHLDYINNKISKIEMDRIRMVLDGHIDEASADPACALFIHQLSNNLILKDWPTLTKENLLLLTKLAFVNGYYAEGSSLLAPDPAINTRSTDDSEWLETGFSKWARHTPFSDEQSPTVLTTLRALAVLKSHDTHHSFLSALSPLTNYLKLTICARALASREHSLSDYAAPIFLPETQATFSDIEGFDKIDLITLFHTGNQHNFDTALEETVNYTQRLLLSQRLTDQFVVRVPQGAANGPTISHIVVLENEQHLSGLIPDHLVTKEETLQIGAVLDAFVDQDRHYRDELDELIKKLSLQVDQLTPKNKQTKHRDPLFATYKNLLSVTKNGDFEIAVSLVDNALRNFSPHQASSFWSRVSSSHEALTATKETLLKLSELKSNLSELKTQLHEFDQTTRPHNSEPM